MDEYLTLAEAAERCHLSPNTLNAQIRHGKIPALKRGHMWFVRWPDVETYLATKSTRGRKPAHVASSAATIAANNG